MSSDANRLRAFNGFHSKAGNSGVSCVAPSLATGASAGDLEDLPDEELIERLKTGPSEPIAVLFARYRQLIFGISMKILRDAAEAEDVLQDIFLEVWEKADHFDPARGSVKVWLLQFAYSRSLNRRRDLTLRWGTGPTANGSMPYRETEPAYFPDTLEKLTAEKQLDRVTAAFGELSFRQQRALQLIYFEGLSIREVAQRTQETLENVRHHYYRGLKRLRETLIGVAAVDGQGQ